MNICASCGSPVPPSDRQCSRCKALVSEYKDRLTGTVLDDKYLIEERLGSGGMCNVYRARHMAMGKEVAIKILKPELAADTAIAQRFEQEARAASRVRHPHAIDVTDYGIGAHNTPYLVMELVEGYTIRELITEYGPFTVERTADILRQTCGALEAAHSVGVIHRDVKPDNILISQFDGRDWVEVVDFGVAKIQEDVNRRAFLTGANHIIGTPRYMSPEQCEEKLVDPRSDIYSLGIVVYEMLTGEAPFDGSSSTQLLMAHVAQPPPALSWKRSDISPEIEAVVMRALEKNPERRQQSATEFAREFEIAAGVFDAGREAGQGGAFSRISVPLDEAGRASNTLRSETLQPAEAELDDQATLVRKRMAPASADDSVANLFQGPDELKPQKTGAEFKQAGPYVGYPTGTREEDADLLPSEPDLHDRQVNPKPTPVVLRNTSFQWRGSYNKAAALLGLFALMLALGFILYAIFWNRSKPSDSTGNKAVESAPAPTSQPAQNTNTSPATERASRNQPAFNKPATVNTTPAPGEPTEETAAVDTGEIRKQVTETIFNAWGALKNRNLNAHMSYYAPRLRTFYLKSDVARATARSEIASAITPYNRMNFRFNNIEVRVDPSGKSAIATYDKSWDFDGDQPWAGTVRERLWLVRNGGRWQINGVRDLKVY